MNTSIKSSILKHSPVVHGGKNSLKNLGKDVIDFSSNVNPLGCPDPILTQLKKNIKNVENYPDSLSSKFLSSLKKYTNLAESNLLVGNGAIEIIYNFCNCFLSKKTKILIPIPTFQEYESASFLNECKIEFFQTMNLANDIDSFILKIPKNGCVFICNPNNPTGELIPKKYMIKIIESARKNSTLVFVDECFIELTPKFNESVLDYVTKVDNLLVLRSLTKSFGIPGIRIGYAAGPSKIIQILNKIKIPWSVNSLAQDAGIIALKNKIFLSKSNKLIEQEYNFLRNKIDQLYGFQCFTSYTNFILIKSKYNSTNLQKKLLKNNILIRDCKNFRGLSNKFFRIAIKSHKENLKLVKALERIK